MDRSNMIAHQKKKPREFWIFDVWDPVQAERYCYDQVEKTFIDDCRMNKNIQIFHVKEVDPEYDSAVHKMVEALKKMPHPDWCEYWNECICAKRSLTTYQKSIGESDDTTD